MEEEVDGGEEDGATQARTSQDQMVKKLVRLALASEYSRRPIKREDITKKGMLFSPWSPQETIFRLLSADGL